MLYTPGNQRVCADKILINGKETVSMPSTVPTHCPFVSAVPTALFTNPQLT